MILKLLIIVLIVLLIWGGDKLPQLVRSAFKAKEEFKKAKEGKEEEKEKEKKPVIKVVDKEKE